MQRDHSNFRIPRPRRTSLPNVSGWLYGLGLLAFAAFAATHGRAASLSSSEAEPAREQIEWLDVWMPHTNDKGLPRVLLIGDSITRAYYPEVEKALQTNAYVARLATSKSLGDPALLAEVSLVLNQARFDLIHLNNGLHGAGYTEAEYRSSLPVLLARMRQLAPHAKLILATTTPVWQSPKMEAFAPFTERVRERNRILTDLAHEANLPVDDLFGLVASHPEYYLGGDGTHLVAKGVSAQAQQVAGEILKMLQAKPPGTSAAEKQN